jgi:transcriptional regulator with XRE-family HTH domain
MDIREVFARNLRKARAARGFSQEVLAHDAGIDRTYISALERGVYGATIDMVDKLARVLGISASDLLQQPPKRSRSGTQTAHSRTNE